MNHFKKAIIGAIIGFVIASALALLGAKLYYRFMPGDWFLNYYYIKVDDSVIGSDVQMTLCRKIRYEKAHINATRTFILKNEQGVFAPVANYDFDAEIERLPNTNCAPLRIGAEDHPQQSGTYKFITEADFQVNGNRKTIRYESNEYKISETTQSIQDRIDELQRQIDDLKAQLAAMPQTRSTTTVIAPGATARTTTPLQPTNQDAVQQNSQPANPPPESILPIINDPLIGCVATLCI